MGQCTQSGAKNPNYPYRGHQLTGATGRQTATDTTRSLPSPPLRGASCAHTQAHTPLKAAWIGQGHLISCLRHAPHTPAGACLRLPTPPPGVATRSHPRAHEPHLYIPITCALPLRFAISTDVQRPFNGCSTDVQRHLQRRNTDLPHLIPPKPTPGPPKSTDAQRTFNIRSTSVQRTFNGRSTNAQRLLRKWQRTFNVRQLPITHYP